MESPVGWTYRVAFNLVRRHHRRAALERRLLNKRPSPVLPDSAIEIWDLVEALPTLERTAFVLRTVADLKEHEIAAVLHKSRSSVAAYLKQARLALRDHLTEAEIGLTDGRP
jgi:DNA-directed RNA polymerase specialized sigma24 family protein